jgi:hypothetical protein
MSRKQNSIALKLVYEETKDTQMTTKTSWFIFTDKKNGFTNVLPLGPIIYSASAYTRQINGNYKPL